MKIKYVSFYTALLFVVIASLKLSPLENLVQYKRWTVSEPIFTSGPAGSFDDAAVKDPSIVYYNGKYHMFYTSKATKSTRKNLKYISKGCSGTGYVSAPTLEELNSAKRYNVNAMYEYIIVAPQIFYFEPQKLWYLVAQTPSNGKPNLQPIYLTNKNIEDIHGWSEPKILKTNKTNDDFWIDFWVICDSKKAHLFYTDHKGSMFRMETELDNFPQGFSDSREETVLTERGETNIGRWRLHEASHIYYVKKFNKYFAILEAVYPHPTRKHYWESRNRFMFGMVADKLEGPWSRVEEKKNDFLGDPKNLLNMKGESIKYDQVSHPELIRSGYDQKCEIDDFNIQILFQAFDASSIADDYDYNELPWELAIMRNY
jgi:endo-1,4-beta-xylanase